MHSQLGPERGWTVPAHSPLQRELGMQVRGPCTASCPLCASRESHCTFALLPVLKDTKDGPQCHSFVVRPTCHPSLGEALPSAMAAGLPCRLSIAWVMIGRIEYLFLSLLLMLPLRGGRLCVSSFQQFYSLESCLVGARCIADD